jgi:hypothetical protein
LSLGHSPCHDDLEHAVGSPERGLFRRDRTSRVWNANVHLSITGVGVVVHGDSITSPVKMREETDRARPVGSLVVRLRAER